jgi:hypothetical protein
MGFEFFKKTKVSVTAVNLRWKGSTHQLGPVKITGRTFEVKIPFQNKPQDDYNMDFLKTQKKPPIPIRKIDAKEPFRLVSVSPSLPVEVNEGDRIEFRAKIEAPDYSYEGPLNIDILSDSSDMVHIEISKIAVSFGGKTTDITKNPVMMDLQKGQVFKQNVHLLGAVDFDTAINGIEIAPPFTFVSSDPKLPFRLDKKTGFLVDVYIQAPQQNYGGPLEIALN